MKIANWRPGWKWTVGVLIIVALLGVFASGSRIADDRAGHGFSVHYCAASFIDLDGSGWLRECAEG